MFTILRSMNLPALWRMVVVFALIALGNHPMRAAAAGSLASPTVQFSSSTYSTGETSGMLTITATLSEVSTQPVTVHFATSNGTAEVGSDYTSASGTLTFPAGIKDGYILNARDFTGLLVTPDPNDRWNGFTWYSDLDETDVYTEANRAYTSVRTNIKPEVSTLAQVPEGIYWVFIQQYGGDGDRSLEVQVAENTPVHTDVGTGPLQWLSVGSYDLNSDTVIKVRAVGGFVNHGQGVPERRGAFTALYLKRLTEDKPTFVADGKTSCPCENSGLTARCPGLTSQPVSVAILNDAKRELSETFFVTLSSPVNAILGVPSQTTVTITGQPLWFYLPTLAKLLEP